VDTHELFVGKERLKSCIDAHRPGHGFATQLAAFSKRLCVTIIGIGITQEARR
jgi:hypothetical protein